jgi:hypothetical protein
VTAAGEEEVRHALDTSSVRRRHIVVALPSPVKEGGELLV